MDLIRNADIVVLRVGFVTYVCSTDYGSIRSKHGQQFVLWPSSMWSTTRQNTYTADNLLINCFKFLFWSSIGWCGVRRENLSIIIDFTVPSSAGIPATKKTRETYADIFDEET